VDVDVLVDVWTLTALWICLATASRAHGRA